MISIQIYTEFPRGFLVQYSFHFNSLHFHEKQNGPTTLSAYSIKCLMPTVNTYLILSYFMITIYTDKIFLGYQPCQLDNKLINWPLNYYNISHCESFSSYNYLHHTIVQTVLVSHTTYQMPECPGKECPSFHQIHLLQAEFMLLQVHVQWT